MRNKTTCEGVGQAWARSVTASNHGGTMRTNGDLLYSYTTVIGYTTVEGQKVLLDYTAATGNFLSMTTSSKHISPTRAVADVILNPSIVQNLETRYKKGC